MARKYTEHLSAKEGEGRYHRPTLSGDKQRVKLVYLLELGGSGINKSININIYNYILFIYYIIINI